LHGSAYRAANLYEFATNFAFDAPTPADEDIRSTELTYEQQLSRQFSYRLTWFYADIHNLISLTAPDPIFVNARQVHNKGTELNLDWRLNNGAQLSAAWSWQHSQDQFGQTLQNSPAQLVKLQYQQPLSFLNARFSLGLNAVSRRQVADTPLPGYVVVQSGLYWQLAQHQLAVQVHNLLDQPVLDRPILSNPPSQQPGRVLSVSWRWQLW
jgi:iron complex outermembrane receptor protein